MNYEMEDTQNSAPGSLPAAQAAKLGAPRRTADAQSTTKRYGRLSTHLPPHLLTSEQPTNRADATDDFFRTRNICLPFR
jgi:ubiquitin-conjugating enzyme E2 C